MKNNSLQGKHIVLGITGSIAAYKACSLIRLLVKDGADVQVVITPAGKEFITPVTLSALTHHPVISEFFSGRDGSWHSHVDLGLWADAMLIAPATASSIGKMAHGIADNMLITTYLSMKAPVFIAPAMDLDMFRHPATTQNLETLKSRGNIILEPASGELASGLVGKGRMDEPENIHRALALFFETKEKKSLKGKKVLITAGPTYEKLDSVRFIGNFSSGKMGYALAEVCAERGATVELVSGPVSLKAQHPSIHVTSVVSAAEMFEASARLFEDSDAAILCAAVADFTPETCADHKIKREGSGGMTLQLVPTKDIAAELGKRKKDSQFLVGFALETDHEMQNAEGKLKRKNLDMIALNSLRDKGAGFGTDTNKVTLIERNGETTSLPLLSKRETAEAIIDRMSNLLPC